LGVLRTFLKAKSVIAGFAFFFEALVQQETRLFPTFVSFTAHRKPLGRHTSYLLTKKPIFTMTSVQKMSVKTCALLPLLFAFCINLQAQHDHKKESTDKPAVHGMLILGMDKIYTSHLPMFHAPHDYQIILEVELDNAAKKTFLKDQAKHPEHTTYTIEPERFVLPDMVENPKPFKANLYRGHFERGGTKIISNATIKITRTVYFKKFIPGEAKSVSSDFILFGDGPARFLAHRISNKPDFEQIIQVQVPPAAFVRKEKLATIALDPTANVPIGVSGGEITVDDNGKKQSIVLLKQLYLEFGDLKE
jgi:hypothetical protein